MQAFPGSERWVRELRATGVRTAVVSSSANAPQVLRAAGIDDAFDAIVDGGEVARLGLRGKPAPDGFLEAARRLGVRAGRAAVVEDALAGVAAGPRRRASGSSSASPRTVDRATSCATPAPHVVVDDLGELAA